jgi:hypothetical protein
MATGVVGNQANLFISMFGEMDKTLRVYSEYRKKRFCVYSDFISFAPMWSRWARHLDTQRHEVPSHV